MSISEVTVGACDLERPEVIIGSMSSVSMDRIGFVEDFGCSFLVMERNGKIVATIRRDREIYVCTANAGSF